MHRKFVALKRIDMLNLKTEKLTKPFKLAWFKSGDEVLITNRSLVRILIEKLYWDELWCDVMPLDCRDNLGNLIERPNIV